MQYHNHEALSVTSSAVVGCTAAYIGGANYAFITCDTAPVRFMVHGGIPTTSTGHQLVAGATLELEDHDELLQFRVIAESVTATLRISYGRQ